MFQGDFDWMMLGYADDKKNTLRLVCVCVCGVRACDLYCLMFGYGYEKKNKLWPVRVVRF